MRTEVLEEVKKEIEKMMEAGVIPRSETEGTKPPYVCLGCSNHMHGSGGLKKITSKQQRN
jgi:hypothetical protein